MVIYKTINKINQKFYIGKDTKNDPNYLGSGLLLNKAIKKYGKNNFEKQILEHCETTDELEEREKYWIRETKAQEIGYNIADGGHGGNTYSEETKQRISKLFKDRFISEETILKRKLTRQKTKDINPLRYKLTEEIKNQISQFHKGKQISQEQKYKNSLRMKNFKNYSKEFLNMQKSSSKLGKKSPMWGTKATEETRKKQSESHKKNPIKYWLGKKQPKEMVEKRIQKRLGTKWSETRRNAYNKKGNSFLGKKHNTTTKQKLKDIQLNKTPEQKLETYIKFYVTRNGYIPSKEIQDNKLQQYRNNKKC